MALTETQHTGEFIIRETGGPELTRETVTVTVATATKLQPGHVLAKLSATGKYVEYDNSGSDGSEIAYAILYAELDNSAGGAPADFTGVVVARLAAVRKAGLKWNSGVDASGKTAAYADLLGQFIVARGD
jgi:hypothetical protein